MADQAADQAQRESWSKAAEAWERRQPELREALGIVSEWMVDAIDPKPGERVLELAAGPGETGFIAAQRLGAEGRLLSTDQSSEMVEVAKRRAAELGLENVDFAVVDAQHIELEPESFDAVLCRFGYMLMGDPDGALRGTHDVLRPFGRIAMAVWDTPDRNLWLAAPVIQVVSRGLMPPPDPTAPSPFAMADPEALCSRLSAAGFSDPRAEKLEFAQSYPRFDDYWDSTLDLAAPVAAAVNDLDAEQVAEVRDGVHDALRQFEGEDGTLTVPATAIVAAARA